jgi:hypothetical protein
MKRMQSGVFAAVVCAAAVSLSAQTPPPTPPAGAPTQPSYGASNKVTVTGCVERAKDSASPTGTSGAAATDTTKFVLNNVAGSPTAPETAGTSGSAKPIASSYRLDAEDSKISPHVGHKIEVTGTVDEKAMGAGAAKLKVDTVKMIAATCTP